MKVLIFSVICLFSNTWATPNEYTSKAVHSALSKVDFGILPVELVEKITAKFDNKDTRYEDISALVNTYADQILDNLRNYLIVHNLNDVPLEDEHLKLKPTGKIDLRNGHLRDLNTIGRREDIRVNYSADTKKIWLTLPLKFDDIKFNYDYHTKALFISIHGGVEGSVKAISVNADLSFDFNTHHAFLDHYDMKDSGKVSLKFTGNKIVDWLTNAMSSVVTKLMGQVVVNVVAKFIRDNLRDIIDQLNQTIDKIINQ